VSRWSKPRTRPSGSAAPIASRNRAPCVSTPGTS
jgi:hypothetical protein